MKLSELLLYPFSVLYDGATRLRNYLYNSGYQRSFEFEVTTISVGNLTVGGTGKTPMIEYIVRLIGERQIVALSRGYGRKTRGFRLAGEADNAMTIGDEPFQFYQKFKKITVAVGEERAVAIPHILAEKPETQVILLDDAFQHRAVKPNFNILLTDFHRLFYNDLLLPAGRLRESGKGARRADYVVVTKCPGDINDSAMKEISENIANYTNAPVAFAQVLYGQPKALYSHSDMGKEVFVFSGLANSQPFETYVRNNFEVKGVQRFKDHHSYSVKDLRALIREGQQNNGGNISFLTTEKDAVKLLNDDFATLLKNTNIYYLPIEIAFIKNGSDFDKKILNLMK